MPPASPASTPTGFLSAGAPNSAGEGDRDSWLTADGVESIAYLRPVPDFPLVIAVSLPQAVVTANSRTALIVISGVIAAAGFGLALIAVVLGRRILLSQARLRQQRDFVTRVLDSADVMVFVQDASGRLISCNAEAEKLGYPQNEILALDPFVHLVPREEQEQVAAIQRRARGAAAPEAYECHLLTRAGERRLIRWSTTNLPDAGGRRDWVLSVGTDVTEERTQQDAIARNNAIMDRAQSIAHMCYWTARAESADAKWADCTFTYSENVEQVFGYSFAEIDVALADFIERFVHPDDQEDMAEAYRAFYEGADQRFAISFRFKQRDGSYRYIRDFAEKRVDTGGGVLELVGMSQDVTQQLAADAMLRESEIKLRRAHRLAKLAYWTYDPVAAAAGGGDRLVFSGDTQEILGAPAEALNGAATSPLIAMAHPEDRERILQEWRAFMASNETAWTFDYRLARGDGEIRDVSVSAEKVMNDRGPVGQVIGVVQDITDRKRSERAIARNETLLRHAHRLSRVGYWVWEPRDVAQSSDRGWLHVSSEFADILGVEPEEVPLEETELVRKFVHPDDLAAAMTAVEGFVHRTADRYNVQFRAVRPDQKIAHVHMEAERLRDSQGRILYEIGVIQDVTEQRERELELMTAKRTAEIANRTKTQFLANMSHELRTPLNAVIGFSQLIRDQAFGQIHERYVNYADDINSSGKLLLALINDILDMSRIEAGQQKLMEEDHLGRFHDQRLRAHGDGEGLRRRRAPDRGEQGHAAGPARRRAGAEADPAQPAVQRRQVHAGGRRRHHRGRGDQGTRPRCLHHRYRHRHRRGRDQGPVPAVPPGRRLDQPPVRRQRPRPCHQQEADGAAWRRDLDRQPSRPRHARHLAHARRARRQQRIRPHPAAGLDRSPTAPPTRRPRRTAATPAAHKGRPAPPGCRGRRSPSPGRPAARR